MPENNRQLPFLPEAINWQEGRLYLLDQTLLPFEERMVEQQTAEDVWESIRVLKVRGAPAIGVAAAYGLCVSVRDKTDLLLADFSSALKAKALYLDTSRPTAVNLGWALKRMLAFASKQTVDSAVELYECLVIEACAIHEEDQRLCVGMGEAGVSLIKEGMGVLTHCNAGAMATSGIGTATAPMYLAHQRGVSFRVFADETRPLLQGARITSWELDKAGVDVTLNTDSMAAHLMSQGLIDIVIVGTDRVAANGDVANKIGTMGLAILAKHFKIPFYVACPSSTYDPYTETGEGIDIEEREPFEVRTFGSSSVAPESVRVRNPAFDVTPSELVTGLITEKGIVQAPYRENMRNLLGK